jgi:hypothetical protein
MNIKGDCLLGEPVGGEEGKMRVFWGGGKHNQNTHTYV